MASAAPSTAVAKAWRASSGVMRGLLLGGSSRSGTSHRPRREAPRLAAGRAGDAAAEPRHLLDLLGQTERTRGRTAGGLLALRRVGVAQQKLAAELVVV